MGETAPRSAGGPTVRVRDATRADAAVVAAIFNESIAAHDSTMRLEPVAGPEVAQWMSQEREALLVLEEDGVVVGWGILKRYSDRAGYRYAAETSVYLWRDRRGRGYGKRLQEAVMERARALGYHHLVAKIWARNEVSLAMHYRFGYELVGVQREIGRVGGKWEDVAILQHLLAEAPDASL